jgi:hypothetical protein
MKFEDAQFQGLFKAFTIPFLGGRPDRVTGIGQDDISDLVIALNTTEDVNDFLRVIG